MENKRAHLAMIQAVIARMGSNSFVTKGWSITLVAALLALLHKDAKHGFTLLACFPAVVFWYLDGYYLWQERLYRRLYDHVRAVAEANVDFSMNAAAVPGDDKGLWAAVFSRTMLAFHPVVIAIVVIASALPTS
jgi:hypothetical protein